VIDYDVRRLPRSLPEWDRLVTALGRATDDTVEASWLELKGPLDLTTKEHRFKVARAILSFANRDPDAAAPFCDGHGLVVIGVAEGRVVGTPRFEDHQLMKALRPYLGNDDRGPRWTVYRHRVDDHSDVLVIVVDAPRPADRIFTLQQAYGNSYAGTIFTRPSTESEPADPAAVEMLSRRLVARTRDFQVYLTLNADAITRHTWDPSVLEPVLEREFQHYWQQVPQPRHVTPGTKIAGISAAHIKALTSISSDVSEKLALAGSAWGTRHEEDRTKEEFREELAVWIEKVRTDFPTVVLDLLAGRLPVARFTVTNTCGRFLEDLEVVVHIDGPVIQHPKPGRSNDLADRLPRRPRRWGPWTERRWDASSFAQLPAMQRPPLPPRPNGSSFRNSGSVTVHLSCAELRPGRSHTFTEEDDHTDVVLLTTDLDLASTRITATATARGIDDTCDIEFTHPVAAALDYTEPVRKFLADFHGYYFKADA
jgi:hypothetical protein